jgi:sulfhydrogenase subunit delta
MQSEKPKLAVYKFASCDGCQLAFLNLGEILVELANLVDIVHFPEAGPVNLEQEVDIAFVEGSVSTLEHLERIQAIRQHSRYLITIGACATAGGIQALRNFADAKEWTSMVYAKPEYIQTLATSSAIARHVKVDLELWGCPVNSEQILSAIRILLRKATPRVRRDSVCIQCKQAGNICVLVAKGEPCLGPVTQTGCGALCPSAGRDCYGCYGPDENPNTASLARRFAGLGFMPEQIARRFLFINNQAPAFHEAGRKAQETLYD